MPRIIRNNSLTIVMLMFAATLIGMWLSGVEDDDLRRHGGESLSRIAYLRDLESKGLTAPDSQTGD